MSKVWVLRVDGLESCFFWSKRVAEGAAAMWMRLRIEHEFSKRNMTYNDVILNISYKPVRKYMSDQPDGSISVYLNMLDDIHVIKEVFEEFTSILNLHDFFVIEEIPLGCYYSRFYSHVPE